MKSKFLWNEEDSVSRRVLSEGRLYIQQMIIDFGGKKNVCYTFKIVLRKQGE